MHNFKDIIYDIKYSPYFLFLAGAVPLAAAIIAQYMFEKHPCPLCIYQRYPYALVIFASVIAMFLKFRFIRITAIFTSILAFLVNCGIAFYHFGVEQHWWEFGDCTAELDISSIEALKASLFSAPIVKCDEVQFAMFGISMAGWNIIYCFFAAIFFLHYFDYKYLHKPQNS